MIPSIIYGTAWKEENTEELTLKAIGAGYRAIDTANQKKHYREDYVGKALQRLVKQGVTRENLFLQSKYTYQGGQDHRLPYNPDDDFKTQVQASFKNTLENLHTDYLDSFVLHGPMYNEGFNDADWEVWGAMEDLYEKKFCRAIGVSNIGLSQLQELFVGAKVKPHYVQNRCFARMDWDLQVREFCLSNSIVYQGFSLLTANPWVVSSSNVEFIAEKLGFSPQQIVFRFCKQIGILPLTGTTSEKHMKDDLRLDEFELSSAQMSQITNLTK